MSVSERQITAKQRSSISCRRDDPTTLDIATLCNALSHPVRVQILCLLIEKNCIFGDLTKQISLAQSTISQHLKKLKNAGLVFVECSGLIVCYCVNRNRVGELKRLIREL